ncbi:PadR family transcriptional regulator [Atopococcus tabaci]|uniref:PadR family transcriptional regulator n=1 Tax=Atopococcus tabaci TaxID=269774 RepID=UPI0003FC3FF4|nr:PadR family transcriptional regulator [Atopococcus tabaci]
MISGDVMRGFNDLLILSLLSKEDSYGYRISQSIKDASGGLYVMKETTLYSAFNRLEKNGLIASYASSETFGKPRTYYRITADGLDVYMKKLVEWEQVKHIIDRFTKEEEKQNGHHS